MRCQYVNRRETHLSLKAPYELVKGSDSSKETFRPENWVPWAATPLALCHCVAGLWEHHSRLSLDRQSMLPKVGQVWEELWHQRPLLRCLQVKVIVQKRATLSSKAGKHHNALGGGGGRSNQNGKHSSPLRRQPLFYILPLSLKWAIAFLPRRLRRAMKAKVLQRCSTHLQIYNKIQHDNFFFPREISGASEQLFPFSQYFSIQHPEKHGEPTVARKAKPNKKQNRDRGEK